MRFNINTLFENTYIDVRGTVYHSNLKEFPSVLFYSSLVQLFDDQSVFSIDSRVVIIKYEVTPVG